MLISMHGFCGYEANRFGIPIVHFTMVYTVAACTLSQVYMPIIVECESTVGFDQLCWHD